LDFQEQIDGAAIMRQLPPIAPARYDFIGYYILRPFNGRDQ
jgi:hypothetical protein